MSGETALYRKFDLIAAPTKMFAMCSSEESAEAFNKLQIGDYIATTWPQETNAWRYVDIAELSGRTGLLIPNAADDAQRSMREMAERLAGTCRGLRVTDTSDQHSDWTLEDFSGSREEFIAWAKARTSPFVPHKNGKARQVMGEVFYRSMADIESKPINWLWPGRIAKGKVSMIVGNPGLGKSQVCASLASVVSNGGLWPVDRTKCARGSVVFLSAEDDPEDTIRPRLEAAEADLKRIYILDAIRLEREAGDGKRGFDLTMDIARLGALLQELGDPALVVIDPITAYLGDADSHNNAEVRALLAPLAEMAAAQRVAVLAVSHLTKSSGMDALLRVQGSIGFAAAARAVWGVAKDKDTPSRRLFMPLKNNLGTDNTGFAYSVEGVTIGARIETSHVMWENQIVTMTADEVFGQADENHEEREAMTEAKMYLRSLLADGPVAVKQIQADSVGAGHSWITLRRAQKDLKIHAYREHGIGERGKWYWRLDGQADPN